MESKKILLVLDWSNLLFRSLFMNSLFSQVNGYNRIEDIRSFMYKFTTDVCSILNIFRPTNVIIATDAQHAWRKDIYADYKSNRKKSESINWDNIFKCSDDLQDILRKQGMHPAKVEHCEADDIAAMCKELLFEKYHDYNMIIVSADADIRQLIDFNPITNQYCIVYNTTGKGKGSKRNLYVPEEFKKWYDSTDNSFDIFFENEDLSKHYVKDLLHANSVMEMTVENPNDVVLSKIFCGDDGDCVPSFYNWYKNGKNTRITPAKAKKIRESLGINTVQDLLDSEHKLKPVFEKTCSIDDINDIDFSDRLNRQRVLVELNSKLFPETIQDYKESLDYMLKDVPPMGFWNVKSQTLLAGTQYEGYDKKKVLEAEIFKGMEKYINKDGGVNINGLF